jgi:hypothetical protein
MSQAVKLPEPFYGFIRREAQVLRRSMPAQLEYLALLGYLVERKGLLNQDQIRDLLNEVPFDLLPPEHRAAKLATAFEEFETLPQHEGLLQELKNRGRPVTGTDASGNLVTREP